MIFLEKEKRNAIIRIALIVAVFLGFLGTAIFVNNIWIRVFAGILAAGVGALLVRIIISIRRKKFYFEGQCIAVQQPKGKFKKTTVYLKQGKITKKLHSVQPVNMKKGGIYGVYFEEKSNEIIKYEALKVNFSLSRKNNKNNPTLH